MFSLEGFRLLSSFEPYGTGFRVLLNLELMVFGGLAAPGGFKNP